MTGDCIRKGDRYKRGPRDRYKKRGEAKWRWGKKLEWSFYKPRVPRIAIHHQKLKENRKNSPLQPAETTWPCQYLAFKCRASYLWKNRFPLFKATQFVVHYGSSRANIYGDENTTTLVQQWTVEQERKTSNTTTSMWPGSQQRWSSKSGGSVPGNGLSRCKNGPGVP